MKTIALPQQLGLRVASKPKRLLIVGPKPPPIGGSPITLQAMLAELASYNNLEVSVINTSPARDVRKKMTGFNFEKVVRSLFILPQYMVDIRRCDAVVVFANDLFAITLAPILLFIARLFGKPFFLKPVGASLDSFIEVQKKPLRAYLLWFLRSTDGILAQTQGLHRNLRELGCMNAYYLPGCRSYPSVAGITRPLSMGLRLIFLAHISRAKGALILLDALRILKQTCDREVHCDFYGPIHEDIRDEFLHRLASLDSARYCGIAEPGMGTQLIAKYDALVLPTFFDMEGHPGVLIEAMHAGVPVIATRIHGLPELVTDGVNGLLVPAQDVDALAEAIRKLAADRPLRSAMAGANRRRGQEFRADAVVEQMLKLIFPDLSLERYA